MCKDKTGILVHPKCNYMLCGSSEQGRKFVAEITREPCKTLHVTQEFPQSFDHHSLGACERIYSTLAEKLKPYISSIKVYKPTWKHPLKNSVIRTIRKEIAESNADKMVASANKNSKELDFPKKSYV